MQGWYGGTPPEAKGEKIVTWLSRGILLSEDLKVIAPRSSKYAIGHPRQSVFRWGARAVGNYCRGRFAPAVMIHCEQRSACFLRRPMLVCALRQHSRSPRNIMKVAHLGNMDTTHNFDSAGAVMRPAQMRGW